MLRIIGWGAIHGGYRGYVIHSLWFKGFRLRDIWVINNKGYRVHINDGLWFGYDSAQVLQGLYRLYVIEFVCLVLNSLGVLVI